MAVIAPGSAAEQAGLQRDDLIEGFAGREIRRDEDFFAAVAAADSPAAMSVRRAGQRLPLKLSAKLPGSPMRWGITWRVDDAEPGVANPRPSGPGSPAARSGLTAGDRIYQVAGRDFAGEEAFARQLKSLADRASLLVERHGRLRIVTLELQHAAPAKRGVADSRRLVPCFALRGSRR